MLRANGAWLRSAGLTREEAFGRNIWDLFPSSSPELRRLHDEVRAGNSIDVPAHRQLRGEREFWYEGRLSPVYLQDGIGILITAIDITERKRDDERRGETEQRLRLHVQSTPVAVVEYDHQFRVTGWNPAAESIFGWSTEEAMGQHAHFIIADRVRAHVDEVFKELLSRRSSQRSVNENVTKDGRTITCEWNNTVLVSSTGQVIGVASLALDVTERHRAQAALAQRERRLHTILRTALDGFYAVDLGGALLEVNDAYCGISGYSRDELLRMNISDLEAIEGQQESRPKLNGSSAGGGPLRDAPPSQGWAPHRCRGEREASDRRRRPLGGLFRSRHH